MDNENKDTNFATCWGTFTSCYSVAHLQTDDVKTNYSPTNADKIEIYSTDKVDKAYTVIGKVVANTDSNSNSKRSVNYLKKEAAKLEADAIISLKLEFDMGQFATGIQASGTAVKINN